MKALLRVLLFSLLPNALICAQGAASPLHPQPEFILLGTVHEMHMKPEMHYSLIDLRHQIEALKPDLICVEIEPEAFQSAMEGYFPPEAAYIASLASELNARVVPTDWRIAIAWQDRADGQTPKSVKKRIEAMGNKMRKALRSATSTATIYDFIHGGFQKMADQQFTQIIGENNAADLSSGAWHERNRRIVENTLDAMGDAKRVLFVYGGAHLPQIARELSDRGFRSHLAPRHFSPAGIQALSPSVIDRWRRNLQNLKDIRDGRIKVSRDNILKVKNSRRIEALEEAIAVYGASLQQ